MNNIYYLRTNILSSSQRQLTLQPKSYRILSPHTYSNSKKDVSSSTSKKTERKYAHLRKNYYRNQQIGRIRPNDQTIMPRKIQGVKINKSGPSAEPHCSSIEMTEKIVFNKVVQAKLKAKNLFLRFNNNSSKAVPHTKCETVRLDVNKRIQNQVKSDEVSQVASNDSFSQMQETFKLQINKRLFLCERCLLYLSVVQIKSHFMKCYPPQEYEDFLDRWQRLTNLLRQNQLHSDSTFRLAELMQSYAKQTPVNKGTTLYSQELTRILNFRLIVESKEIWIAQLFEVVQRIGDKLESIHRKDSFWRLCS